MQSSAVDGGADCLDFNNDCAGEDADMDGVTCPADCDDTDPQVAPGFVPESATFGLFTCSDGKDNDCDGLVDCADFVGCPNGTSCGLFRICLNGVCT